MPRAFSIGKQTGEERLFQYRIVGRVKPGAAVRKPNKACGNGIGVPSVIEGLRRRLRFGRRTEPRKLRKRLIAQSEFYVTAVYASTTKLEE